MQCMVSLPLARLYVIQFSSTMKKRQEHQNSNSTNSYAHSYASESMASSIPPVDEVQSETPTTFTNLHHHVNKSVNNSTANAFHYYKNSVHMISSPIPTSSSSWISNPSCRPHPPHRHHQRFHLSEEG